MGKAKKAAVDFTLPARLDNVDEDVCMGSVLRNLGDNRVAMVVDVVEECDRGEGWGRSVFFMIVTVSGRARARAELKGELPSKPSDYLIKPLPKEDWKNWIVLTFGDNLDGGYALIP